MAGVPGVGTAAAFDVAVPIAEYAWAWSRVDDHLFTAVEHMTHESINSVADLGRVLSEHDWAVSSWSGADKHLIESVKGHLGEWLAADHLSAAGHVVDVPLASNQAGFDLVVDGHPFNVKTVKDAAQTLHEHFTRYPDVGVILPHDAAHLPTDALNFDPTHALDLSDVAHGAHGVIVDHALSNADAFHAAQSGMDVASGHVDAHFPFVTMAVSTFRESRLLMTGNTDLLRASKNVAVDTVAVGGSAALGTKIGGTLGTFITPGIGTAIGGVIGGLIGGLSGRYAANTIKFRPLREAQAAFEASQQEFGRIEAVTTATAESTWSAVVNEQRSALDLYAKDTRDTLEISIGAARTRLTEAVNLKSGQCLTLLDDAAAKVDADVATAREQYLAIPAWRRWIWPDEDALASRKRLFDVKKLRAAWHSEATLIRDNPQALGTNLTPRVFDLVLCVQDGESTVRSHLYRVGVVRAASFAKVEKARRTAIRRMLDARAAVANRLRERQAEVLAWVRGQLEPSASELKAHQDNLIGELRKAGVSV